MAARIPDGEERLRCRFVFNRNIVHFFEIKKLRERHIQAQSDMMQRFDPRIFRQTSDDIINGRLVNAAHQRKLVECDASFFAQ